MSIKNSTSQLRYQSLLNFRTDRDKKVEGAFVKSEEVCPSPRGIIYSLVHVEARIEVEPIEEEKNGGKELKKHAIIWENEVQIYSLKKSYFLSFTRNHFFQTNHRNNSIRIQFPNFLSKENMNC